MKNNYTQEEDKRTCLYCNDPLNGRIDKKFCGADCRSSYHNRLNSSVHKRTRRDNKILMNNRKILNAVFKKGTLKIEEHELIQQGFNFQYCTRVLKNSSDTTTYYCYDFGYIYLENKMIAIFQSTS